MNSHLGGLRNDVLALPAQRMPPPALSPVIARPQLVTGTPPRRRYNRLNDRPTHGDPIDFRGLRHEPVNEQGVVLLFGMVAREFGYQVEAVQTAYPDCEAKRQVDPGKVAACSN